ncbi:hypothetical protein NECAME_08513 [Necator americanus]|uniref:Uncharacterized protein n=1 Tax=Necator americanus TaxID=51031 RepID=W2TIH8_NECAM|nr:hypothetical protein NECAME_08513 [Necator americanus]ETN81384.1 hypothetical protein NECAME_08513 [Necator americanus]
MAEVTLVSDNPAIHKSFDDFLGLFDKFSDDYGVHFNRWNFREKRTLTGGFPTGQYRLLGVSCEQLREFLNDIEGEIYHLRYSSLKCGPMMFTFCFSFSCTADDYTTVGTDQITTSVTQTTTDEDTTTTEKRTTESGTYTATDEQNTTPSTEYATTDGVYTTVTENYSTETGIYTTENEDNGTESPRNSGTSGDYSTESTDSFTVDETYTTTNENSSTTIEE